MTNHIYHYPLILIIPMHHVENHIIDKKIDWSLQYVNNGFMKDVLLFRAYFIIFCLHYFIIFIFFKLTVMDGHFHNFLYFENCQSPCYWFQVFKVLVFYFLVIFKLKIKILGTNLPRNMKNIFHFIIEFNKQIHDGKTLCLLSWYRYIILLLEFTEEVARRCLVKKMFLEISQNSQENTCARVSFLIKLQAWGLQIQSFHKVNSI